MKRSVKKTRWNLIIILIIFGAISYAGLKYFMPAPQQADIFAITPVEIQYGETTVSGVLRKDSPAGGEGNYLLELDDMRIIVLEVSGVDNLLGQNILVSGILSPATSELHPMSMLVSLIKVN
jgi:hypothetical protein